MTRKTRQAGFTLIELMIVVALIAVIAAIAIPRMLSARLSANEAAAISTLRSIATAQAQIRSSGAIDTDLDGAGEYGYFGELSGVLPVRISAVGVPAAGVVGTDELFPSILSSAFGRVQNRVATRQGYMFQMWLPAPTAGGFVGAVPEDLTGGKLAAPFPDSNNGEILWACYAWPVEVGKSGNRAFFASHEGELLQYLNRSVNPYTNTTKTPAFDEAFAGPGDMSSALRIGVVGGADLTVWTPVQI